MMSRGLVSRNFLSSVVIYQAIPLKLKWKELFCSIIFPLLLIQIFPRFWLVKTTHNSSEPSVVDQIWKESLHIEPMTSKVQPAADYWTDDVKSAARCRLLNRWPRKPEDEIVTFGERRNNERNGETPLRRRKYFEWIIEQLLNSAFVGYEEFCRSCGLGG